MKWNRLVIYLVIMASAAAAWKWTPAGRWVSIENLTAFAGYLRGNPAAPLLVVAAYLVLGFLVVPLLPKVVATTLIFGAKMGFVYSLLGSLSSAMALYGVGRLLGKRRAQQFARSSFDTVTDHLADHGMIAMTIIRMLPLAPFTIINFVAGAIRIRVLDYTLGTIIGMTPMIFLISLFSNRLLVAIRHPGLKSYIFLGAVALFLGFVFIVVRYWLQQRSRKEETGASS